MQNPLNERLAAWLDAHAEALDAETVHGDTLLPMLAAEGLLRVGVPVTAGGTGGPTSAAIAVVAALAAHSLSAAFVFWAQRAAIECLLNSPNRELAGTLLPRLLDGSLAGAPGLSNAMRSLSGFDRLQVRRTPGGLEGAVPWATNLQAQGVVIAVAADCADGRSSVYAIPGDAAGVVHTANADLIGLGATRTGAVQLNNVVITGCWLIHPDARAFLPGLRPAFLALQCGWGIGLARACLDAARGAAGGSPSVLLSEIDQLEHSVEAYWRRLAQGIDSGAFAGGPADLFASRLKMVDLATAAGHLELQALGSRAWSRTSGAAFARRRREAAFLPIVTPSMVQLKTELARLGE